jgi:hypothetical protein
MKLTTDEKNLLIKLLENTVERFERDDLVHMIKGPKYYYVLDGIYQQCFRPHIKHGFSVLDGSKEMDDKESEVIQAIWDKLNKYLHEELEEN